MGLFIRESSNLSLGAYNRRLLARFANQRLSKPAPNHEISPLQLIAKASSAALELAEAGDVEPALKVLNQLAQMWGHL